jgi:FdhD protein
MGNDQTPIRRSKAFTIRQIRADQPANLPEVPHLASKDSPLVEDRVAIEEPLEIRIGSAPLAITMRTPGHDRDLAAGFCFTEGIVKDGDEIERVEACLEAEYGNIAIVTLTEEALANCKSDRDASITAAQREMYVSSSCGLCGKQSIDRIRQSISPIESDVKIESKILSQLSSTMRKEQATFDDTGGLHAAALFKSDGTLIVLREDVGRHNAVDKVIGASLLAGQLPLSSCILLVSGRTSFEIMQKAATAGIPVVAAISAPSSLAVEFAQELNMTLIGFLRGEKMNIYHDDAKRMILSA